MTKSLAAIQKEFAFQSLHPPDPYIGAFNIAVSHILTQKTQKAQKAQDFIKHILAKRSFTPSHFVNLFFRACQHLILHYNGHNYPQGYDKPSSWEKLIYSLIQNQSQLLSQILLQNQTTTTKYQRYAGLKYILSAMSSVWGTNIEAIDLACGGNHGLPGISNQYPFEYIDSTQLSDHFSKHLSQKLSFERILALDLQNPKDSAVKKWRHSCSFYPSELHQAQKYYQFEEQIYAADPSTFITGDIRLLPPNLGKFHAVSILTALYQMPSSDIAKSLNQANNILKSNGILIIQDFAQKTPNPKQLIFSENWFKQPYTYRTFIKGQITNTKFWEIFRWKSSRCLDVLPGEDFAKFLDILNSQ